MAVIADRAAITSSSPAFQRVSMAVLLEAGFGGVSLVE
jgi:hypothetical protein